MRAPRREPGVVKQVGDRGPEAQSPSLEAPPEPKLDDGPRRPSNCPHCVPQRTVRRRDCFAGVSPDPQTATCTPQEEDTSRRSRPRGGYRLRLTPECLMNNDSHRPTIHRLPQSPQASYHLRVFGYRRRSRHRQCPRGTDQVEGAARVENLYLDRSRCFSATAVPPGSVHG